MIYFGKTAKIILEKNLIDRTYYKCKGYFKEGNLWIAYDNQKGECYLEEFNTEDIAICWLEEQFEISEMETFKVFKIVRGIYFIPKNGFLTISFAKETIQSKFYPWPFLRGIKQ